VAFVVVFFGGGRRRFRGREILFSGVGGGQSVLPSRIFVGGWIALGARSSAGRRSCVAYQGYDKSREQETANRKQETEGTCAGTYHE
jgi:hypothetical protein